MNADLKQKALAVFDNLETIIEYERLQRVGYISTEDLDTGEPFESVPVCNGYQACLIGSCLISAGVKNRPNANWGEYGGPLRGTNKQREYAARYRPELIPVYDALNEVADRYFKRNPVLGRSCAFEQPCERLFESGHPIGTNKARQKRFVRAARALVEAA